MTTKRVIRVKYIECLSNNDDVENSEATSVEREMLVNINCSIKMILDYIRKVARVKGEYDLCDEINCQLKNVSHHEPYMRGTDILQSEVTYIIITFDRDENRQMRNLTPLLIGKTAKKNCNILLKMRKSSRKTWSNKSMFKKRSNAQ